MLKFNRRAVKFAATLFAGSALAIVCATAFDGTLRGTNPAPALIEIIDVNGDGWIVSVADTCAEAFATIEWAAAPSRWHTMQCVRFK